MRPTGWVCYFAAPQQKVLPKGSAERGSFFLLTRPAVQADFVGSFEERLQRVRLRGPSICHVVSLFLLRKSRTLGTLLLMLSLKRVYRHPGDRLVYSSGYAEAGPVIRMGSFSQYIPASVKHCLSDCSIRRNMPIKAHHKFRSAARIHIPVACYYPRHARNQKRMDEVLIVQ